ncbi:translocation/assembly module TamB domain-containing protein [Sphingobacterium sp. SYP-B4668]|uniref:translocation/assembly module TamB domain-containing protein n=1 Tax=Sphingobacterium sp. SYP-B4668 TaxID=2996035 RepID=UPI0022DD00A7|nr:translocation/assembly module TamB [Sphingobacterium sp. SYP-B4668]
MFSLQYKPIQTYFAQKTADYLSKELHADISIESLYFKPFSSLVLQNLKIDDKNGNNIFFSEKMEADINLSQWRKNKIIVNKLYSKDTRVDFQIFKDSTNFTFLIDYFAPNKKVPKKNTSSTLALVLNEIVLENNRIKIVNNTKKHTQQGVDFGNLEISKLSGKIDHIQIDSSQSISAHITKLAFSEKSGLQLKELSTEAFYSNRRMEFNKLKLITNRSRVTDYLKFEYDSLADFTAFMDKVKVKAALKNSFVSSRDIEYFATDMKFVKFDVLIPSAQLSGTVANASARNTTMRLGKDTELEGDFTIRGLPRIAETIFDINVKTLKSNAQDLEDIIPKLGNMKSFALPKIVHQLKNIHYKGLFKGFYNDFKATGSLETALGNIQTETSINLKKELTYKGHVRSNHFAIHEIAKVKNLGHTGLSLTFDGKGTKLESLDLQVKGRFNSVEFKGYQYEKLDIDAQINDRFLHVSGLLDDRNAKLDFHTDMDWKRSTPSYLLEADIENADLYALNLFKKDTITIHKTTLSTNIQGDNINNIIGNLAAKNIHFTSSKGTFVIDFLDFNAEGNEAERHLILNSDILEGNLKGQIDLTTIVPYFKSLAMRYAPAIGIEIQPYNKQEFDLFLNIKSFAPIASFLDPNLTLEDGATLNANFSSEKYTAQFQAYSPTIKYSGIKVTNLIIEENANQESLALMVTADKLNLSDSLYIDNINLTNILSNDSLHFNIKLSEQARPNFMDLNGNILFAHNKPAYIHFFPSTLQINHEEWNINQDALARISKGKLYFDNLKLSQGEQEVIVDGVMSDQDDRIKFAFNNFGLSSLDGFTKPLGIRMQGKVNGNVQLNSLFKKPYLNADLQTTPIIYNGLPIGQLALQAAYDPDERLVNMDLKLADGDRKGLTLAGTYNISDDRKNEIDLVGKLVNTDLIILQPFLRNLVSDLRGTVSGDVTILGSATRPEINAVTRFKEASFTVNYLQTPYRIADDILQLSKNNIILNNFKIFDPNNHVATANGYVNLNRLSDPHIDIDIDARNFLALNTTYKDNNLYFGKAYATGEFKFKGPTSAMNIDIRAKSNENTTFTIPFNSAMTVTESDFIYFISPDSAENKKKDNRKTFQGLSMNMDLNITPDAEVNLQTDLGSLKGRGTGALNLKISSLGDFEMFGDYVTSSGKFNFTAQDFINKIFDIKEGGTIRWAGNPSDAVINLSAMYEQRTSVAPLYNAAGRSGNDQRVLAQADMVLKGNLTKPDISFALNFPQDPYIKDELQSYLSDANNVNQQAMSLIMRRSFSPGSSSEFGKEVNSTLLSAGTELAFNQLNTIISQSLNINFFDLNIRSLNDASASLRFFDDRLIITGGVTDRRNLQLNDLNVFSDEVATDAELSYRLRKDGSLILRGSNRLNTRNFLLLGMDNDYVSAVGLVYRQEFNSFSEFFKRMLFWRRLEDEINPQKKQIAPKSK